MGGSQYAQSWQIFSMNSGLFYLRANERTIHLMEQIMAHLQRDKMWDQSAFNYYVLRPSSPAHEGSGVSVRIMDYELFMNTKHLFKFLRKQAMKFKRSDPVMVRRCLPTTTARSGRGPGRRRPDALSPAPARRTRDAGARQLPPGQVGEDEVHHQMEEGRRRLGAHGVSGRELLPPAQRLQAQLGETGGGSRRGRRRRCVPFLYL